MRKQGFGAWATACLLIGLVPMIAASSASLRVGEPIAPIPAAPSADPSKIALGELLFTDSRLSRDNSRSCATCHRLQGNGATGTIQDPDFKGHPLEKNTSTVFNSALSFRLGWEGDFETLESQAIASIRNERTMGGDPDEIVRRLEADASMVSQFDKAYGRRPDMPGILDALATFQRSLLTPGSRFDKWLLGDADALSDKEKAGYDLFKSLGCISCHQGVNVGGNMFQRPGIFRTLVPGSPPLLRVPSLRNVAVTAPYFHDGSSKTLEEAVHRMGMAQLDIRLTDDDVELLAGFLRTLTGDYKGKPLSEAR